MPSSFGQWLIVILALLVGAAAGWALRGRQDTSPGATPIVEGDPVAGVAVVPSPAAVPDRPAPDTASPTPPGGVLGDADPVLDRADEPAATDAPETEPATETEPVAVAPVEPVNVPTTEPVDESSPAEPVAETEAVEPVAETATPVVPAPRTPVDDAVPPAADGSEAQDAPAEPAAVTPADLEPAPAAEAASTGAADDFRRIQGIGPKMAAALQDAGIRTYRQLADLDEAALRETIRAAGLRAAPSLATWPQQAEVLAGAPAEADRVLPVGGTDG